jgi:hypothetical protein
MRPARCFLIIQLSNSRGLCAQKAAKNLSKPEKGSKIKPQVIAWYFNQCIVGELYPIKSEGKFTQSKDKIIVDRVWQI